MRINTIVTNTKNIILAAAQNRKKIAGLLADASAYDIKSAFHLKKGDYEKAASYAITAQEYIRLANDIKIEDLKLHALYN